jgi:diadenylate cyclase
MQDIISEILFLFQRFDWLTVLDLFLVSIIFYVILVMVRDTQAMSLVRGVIFLLIVLSLLTTLINLPAFSWLVTTALPTLFLAIPVIFAPEIRRGLERLGRAGTGSLLLSRKQIGSKSIEEMIEAVKSASERLASNHYGALIVIQLRDNLYEFIESGVKLGAKVTPELLLQIFYPNTPLHDGAAIIVSDEITAASCIMPLSSQGILNESPEHKMGLRHRAGLGISEVSDAIAIVISEETGVISLAHRGRIIPYINAEKLVTILKTFFQSDTIANQSKNLLERLRMWFNLDHLPED